jgi:opacity protein-like surface antigen
MKPMKSLIAAGLILGLLTGTCAAQYNQPNSAYLQGYAQGRAQGQHGSLEHHRGYEDGWRDAMSPQQPHPSWQKEQDLKAHGRAYRQGYAEGMQQAQTGNMEYHRGYEEGWLSGRGNR